MGAGPIFFCGLNREKIGRGSCHISFKYKLPTRRSKKIVKIGEIDPWLVREQLPDGPFFMCHIDREPTDAQIKRWEREAAARDEDDGDSVPPEASPRRGRGSEKRAPGKARVAKRRAR